MLNDPESITWSKSKVNKLIGDDCWIATSVTRNARGELLVSLKFYKFNQWNDIFIRGDRNNRHKCELRVKLCGYKSLRHPGDSINVWRTRINIQSQSDNDFRYKAANLSRGSSGDAAFVYPSLKVIATNLISI